MRWDENTILQVRKLRVNGKTYSEVNTILKLDIPKSTMSNWTRNINLPRHYYIKINKLNKLNLKKARKLALIANKKKLNERLRLLQTKNINLLKIINKDVGKLMLAMLYLCEGAKYPTTSQVKFGSSHPGMIRLFISLLRECFELDESKFRGKVQCRADQKITKLEKYWSQIASIPLSKFNKSWIDKRTVGKPTKKQDYMGVFVINYFDTDIQLELQFLGEYLGKNGPVAQLVERLRGTQEVRGSTPLGST